ncbi:unnamed protein product [Mycena citricolor]|uniref:Uncharacterized protein n=1 Tax=Mycena citricolor TaxID=2018698 RepID=A0AAD2Q131_9AGAR|nr:unnamed protein product [Mycena citricolor]
MIPSTSLAAFVALNCALVVSAGVYFVEPSGGITCTSGQSCALQWLDDGNIPVLADIGVVTVGLYTANQQLVQSIEPLDVSESHSFQFTPDAEAGPNSKNYYISFISTTAKVNGTAYAAFSPSITLNGMSGNFASPLASATSSIPIPSTLAPASIGSVAGSTITVGTIHTSFAPISTSHVPTSASATKSATSTTTSSTSSGFATSSIPSIVPSSSPSASKAAASSGAGISPPSILPSLLSFSCLALAILSL